MLNEFTELFFLFLFSDSMKNLLNPGVFLAPSIGVLQDEEGELFLEVCEINGEIFLDPESLESINKKMLFISKLIRFEHFIWSEKYLIKESI